MRAKKATAIKKYYRETLDRISAIEACVEVNLMDLAEVESLHKELNLPKIDVANY